MSIRNLFLGAAATLAIAAPASASVITITFDEPQAGYTPGSPGSTQEVTNQFASLGVVFKDQKSPGFGATIGKCGPGEGAFAFFGHGADFGGCGDTRPDIDVVFVNPLDGLGDATTDFFSIFNYDGLVQATAYDLNNVALGSVQTFSGALTLSGLGAFHRVNLKSLDGDPTTMDTLQFEQVTASGAAAVPEPAAWALMIMGFGAVGASLRNRRSALGLAA